MNKIKIVLLLVIGILCFIGCGREENEESAVSGTAVTTVTPPAAVKTQDTAGESVSAEAVGGTDGSLEGDEAGGSELHRMCCQFVKQIVAGLMGPVIETMTPELASQMTEEQLQKSWEGEIQGLSGYQGIETVVETVGDDTQKVIVSVRYANNNGMKINFTFNEELPPPTVIIFRAFSPMTAIFLTLSGLIGRRFRSFFNSTMPSSPIFRAAVVCSGEHREPKGRRVFIVVRNASRRIRRTLSSSSFVPTLPSLISFR